MTTTVAAEMMNNTTAEAEYARCKTSVWWDIENCAVPKGCDAHGITQKLTTALTDMNYCGPLSISSYGNTDLIPKVVQHALSSTGISLNHVPPGRKDASDKKILVDMFLWVVENPPPANIMLISGDIDFSDALHRLRMRRYNILLAHPQKISPSLVASANTSWLWRSLITSGRGSSLTQCESSGVVDGSEITSEDALSTQAMDLMSGSSKDPRSKLKGIYVPKAPNELLIKETKGKKLQKKCSESVQNIDKESLNCLEKQNKELMETIATSGKSGRESSHKEMLDRDGEPPFKADHVFGSKEVRKCSDAIPMKVEPTQNEIVIEELEGMLRQVLQIKPSEPENAPASPSENQEEDMNKKKVKKRKKKMNRVTEEDKADEEPYICSICNVICDNPAIFESHLNGRKHAATIENLTEAMVDDSQVHDDIIQDNGPGEAPENTINYLDNKQRKEMQERCGVYEWSGGEFSQAFEDVLENDYTSLPKEITELNSEFWSPKEEAREWIDAIFNTPDLSQDANITRESESLLNQSLEMNSGDPVGITEHPEEFMEKVSKDKAEPEAYVCSICSVVCACPTVFESHLLGRRHAAKVKKHAEVLFDDKKILEESLKEKEQIPSAEFEEPKEARERLDSTVLLEDTSLKQTVVEAGSASERENGTQIRVCDWCNVTCSSQMDFYSHMTGKKHAATVKKYEQPIVKKQAAVVKKQAGTKFAYVRKNGP